MQQTYDYDIPSKPLPPRPKRSANQSESIFSAMNDDVYVARVVVYDDTKLVSVQDHGTDKPNMLLGRTQPPGLSTKPPLSEKQPITI